MARVMSAKDEWPRFHGTTISYLRGVTGGEVFEPINYRLS